MYPTEKITQYVDEIYDYHSIENNFKEFDKNIFLDKISEINTKYQLDGYEISSSEDFDNLFILYIPSNKKYESMMRVWDKIIIELEQYCKDKEMENYLDNNGVVLRYR